MKKTKSSKRKMEQANEIDISLLMNSGLRICEIHNKKTPYLSCHNADIKVGSNSFKYNYITNPIRLIENNLGHMSINMTAKYINNARK